jgi:hypothetical protein
MKSIGMNKKEINQIINEVKAVQWLLNYLVNK